MGDAFYASGESYTPHNIDAISEALKTLKKHHSARKLIVVGHSGGANIGGVIIGRHPGLLDGAVLSACAANLQEWADRYGTARWTPARSLSPHTYAKYVPKTTKVIAITGDKDTNSWPSLARDYVRLLQKHGVQASFIDAKGCTHGSVLSSADFNNAVWTLINES
jgi:predicted esterase